MAARVCNSAGIITELRFQRRSRRTFEASGEASRGGGAAAGRRVSILFQVSARLAILASRWPGCLLEVRSACAITAIHQGKLHNLK
jgi:hypothetical protein